MATTSQNNALSSDFTPSIGAFQPAAAVKERRRACVAHLVLEATGPENVDTVVVDGRILKRGGKLIAVDTAEVIAGARTALAGIRERTKWR